VHGAMHGARKVHTSISFPLCFFSAPHTMPPLLGEPACCGCGIGRQAMLRWLS
jgi:hypothetical protein